jgi:hypothetical protein
LGNARAREFTILTWDAQDIIKTPDICICLDAGTANYDALWVTSSLRGMVACNVKAQSIEKGQHSGTSGGIVPETFSGVAPRCGSPLPIASDMFHLSTKMGPRLAR